MPIEGRYHVEVCDWANAADREALIGVRNAVFVLEQRVPLEMEVDEDDPRSVHVLARSLDGAPIGTGRLTGDARIGRLAVLPGWRGDGVGSTLLQALLDAARAQHQDSVTLHAQRAALPFYLRHGFTTEDVEFEEAGIPHVLMRRALAAAVPPDRPSAGSPPRAVELHSVTREELIAATRTLLAAARHSLCLLVRELHPLLLDDTACLVELRRIAISGRGASIRILAQDLTRALQEGTRMLDLAQRLPSVFELRRPVEPQDLAYHSAFMCVDTGGYLFRPLDDDMIALGSTWSPGRRAELMDRFEEIWQRAEPWTELRTLGI